MGARGDHTRCTDLGDRRLDEQFVAAIERPEQYLEGRDALTGRQRGTGWEGARRGAHRGFHLSLCAVRCRAEVRLRRRVLDRGALPASGPTRRR